MTFGIRMALGLIGFSAVVGQIVLMRELIVVFNGNEISLGIMFATWLFWTAIGSMFAGRIVGGISNARKAVAALECLLGLSLPPTVWFLRASRTYFQTVPGELVGPVPMLLTSLVCLSVFCLLSGGLFVVAARMYQLERGVSARIATSSAYLLEAAGAALGGIAANLLLLRLLESVRIAILVALLNLCMAATLWFSKRWTRLWAAVLAIVIGGSALLVYVAPVLITSSQERLWKGFHLLGSRDSIYGNLAVTETGNIRSIYENGVILGNAPDDSAAEEAIHYALLEHPSPRKVLLIGGGVNGGIGQALKHATIARLDYVELDPALIYVAREFLPASLTASYSDPRVHIHYADGRRYLKMTHDQFDLIIVDVPDPQTAQLNRFYTSEFFRSARDHLAIGGVLALQLRSSEDYISPDLAEFLRCIYRTAREGFPHIVTIPGETLHLFAAIQPDVLTDDPQVLIARLHNRQLETQYVREYFIPFRMMPDRMAQIRDLIEPLPTTPVNSDFKPIAYYFDVVLWSAQFKSVSARPFQSVSRVAFTPAIATLVAVLFLIAVAFAFLPPPQKRVRSSVVFCVAATGFTLMTLQIFLLLAFQSVYGYVYHQLATLIAMFMAGIAFGNWLGMRRGPLTNAPLRIMAAVQFLMALSALALMFLIQSLAQISGGTSALLTAQFIFPALAACSGMLGGYQFPVATSLYLKDDGATSQLGVLYAVDLAGGCVGALLLSGYLIPVFGFWKTAWISAAVNLAPALLAARLGLEARLSRA